MSRWIDIPEEVYEGLREATWFDYLEEINCDSWEECSDIRGCEEEIGKRLRAVALLVEAHLSEYLRLYKVEFSKEMKLKEVKPKEKEVKNGKEG